MPLAVFERLLRGVVDRLRGSNLDDGRWRGHRTFLADGSSLSMPDTPALQEHFGQPGMQKTGCGFPIMHVLALFHAATGLLLRVVASPLRTHDMSQIGLLHPELEPISGSRSGSETEAQANVGPSSLALQSPTRYTHSKPALAAGDVLVGDRAFCSFAHLALLKARQIFGVFRVHQQQIVDFRPRRKAASAGSRKRGEKGRPSSRWLMRLGRHDQLVVYDKPKSRPCWLTAEAYAGLPATLVVRELRYTIRRRGYRTRLVTLATTLLDPAVYPAAEVAELYGRRWQVETNLRHLKQTLRMDVLRCQTIEGVQKELTMYGLVDNMVRLVMLEAAEQQHVPVERISFIDAVRWLAAAVAGDAPLELRVNPNRPGRVEPRVIKRRSKTYSLMIHPRAVLRKRLLGNKHAA